MKELEKLVAIALKRGLISDDEARSALSIDKDADDALNAKRLKLEIEGMRDIIAEGEAEGIV